MNAEAIIEALQLEPLPKEGGFFRRVWTHSEQVTLSDGRKRPLSSSIYYLMTDAFFSGLHKLKSAETFFFHGGDRAEMLQLAPDGTSKRIMMGFDLKAGEQPRVHVPENTWQGSRLIPGGKHGYALFSAVVNPGFEWEDFELGTRDALIAAYPKSADDIAKFTYL